MTPAEDRLLAAVLMVLEGDVKDEYGTVKESVLRAMQDLDVKTAFMRLPDGTIAGTWTVVRSEAKAQVTNARLFKAWVEKMHPEGLETIVRKNFTDAVLKECDTAQEPVDRVTGEVIPGVEFVQGEPYVTPAFVKGDRDGKELIRRAWRSRQVDLNELLALALGAGSDSSGEGAAA